MMTNTNTGVDVGANGYPMPGLEYVETQGNPADQADDYIENIDTLMREAYDKHIARVGNNIYPILYVDFTLTGGRYNLVIDKETTISKAPDLKRYAQLKSVAHVPLGIFVRISEYFSYADNDQWVAPLVEYRDALMVAKTQLPQSSLSILERGACDQILTQSIAYINTSVTTNSIDFVGFQTFTKAISSYISICMRSAANVQVAQMSNVVSEFKTQLGSRWDDVFVVISALWTLTKDNIHELIIGHHMAAAKRRTNLIVSEGVETLADAKLLLGRIVGDRIAAHGVFTGDGAQQHEENENIFSLSTQRDLLSQGGLAALNHPASEIEVPPELAKQFKELCPHAAL